MTQELTDNTGEPVTVGRESADPISAFTVNLPDAPRVGRAEFIDSADADRERIFFHTEVDEHYAGRGLAGILLREALADSIRSGHTVVPVCPLIARHLKKHGDEFISEGGAWRTPTRADVALVSRLAHVDS